jgi:antitoxin (DNA-binding transcriptional repressor) of toxin-antitoxin stability system
MSADCDQESLPDEEVHFFDAERPVAELVPIEEDERIAGEVFDLRHLLIVQAVLDGQRVEPEWDRKRVQVIARGVDEVDPDVSARRPGGQRGCGRRETGHPTVLGDVKTTQV